MKKQYFSFVLVITMLYPCLAPNLGFSSSSSNDAKIVLISDTDKDKDSKTRKVVKYPNPIDNILYLGSKSGFNYNSHALLTTLSGNVIAQLFPSAAMNQLSFDFSQVPNGTYLIICNSRADNEALQVVVQHN